LFSKGIDSSVAKNSFRMTVAFCHSDDKRNLNVIPTEKLFASTRNLNVIPTEKPFLLRRGIYVLSIKRDSSVAKSSFRMTAAFCHSDDKRNLNVIPTEKLFASTRNLCAFDKKRFFSRLSALSG